MGKSIHISPARYIKESFDRLQKKIITKKPRPGRIQSADELKHFPTENYFHIVLLRICLFAYEKRRKQSTIIAYRNLFGLVTVGVDGDE